MSHSAEDCFGKLSDKNSVRDILGGTMVSKSEAVNHYKRSEIKWNKELKYIKNKNKILYSIVNKYGSLREIKNIDKIRDKVSKKRRDDSSDSSRNESDSNSSLSRNSDWDEHRHPSGRKDINRLDHIVTDNINNNKDQLDDSIYNELTFDTNSFSLSRGTKYPLPVVTVRIRGDNKHRAKN